ncbi:MAG TPA: DUF4124 domain-containing protein [Rhodanobacteraceae bacterium]|nr:DUF4124 domain-containing protein [Rhodanobacteraceae bacterium]
MSRLPLSAALALAMLAVCVAAGAQQVYKWKDANGATHYSDTPPPAGANYDKVKINSNVATPVAATPASAASSMNNGGGGNDLGWNSMPLKAASDTPENRTKLCKQLDSNIALLNSKQPVTSGDAGTPQQNMGDVQRNQELATARAQKDQYCTN